MPTCNHQIKSPGEALSTYFRVSRDPKGEKVGLKTKNDAQTLPYQVPNNFEKVHETTFSTPKMNKNDPHMSNVGQILNEKYYFRGNLLTFGAENTAEIWAFKTEWAF